MVVVGCHPCFSTTPGKIFLGTLPNRLKVHADDKTKWSKPYREWGGKSQANPMITGKIRRFEDLICSRKKQAQLRWLFK